MKLFTEFCDAVRFPLSPAQRVYARVAYDGLDPIDLVGEERELARSLFGDVERVPPAARAILAVIAGRGSGKSRLCGARLLHRALTADLSMLGPGESGYCISVAPDRELAGIAIDFAKGLIENSRFARAVESETSDSIVLRRPDGKRVAIEVFAASAGAKSIRGKTIVEAVLDECAFFGDATRVVNADDLLRGMMPRLIRGGAIHCPSTPWIRSGLLWDLHEKNHSKPSTALVAQAPTLLFRGDDPAVVEMVEREFERDPDNARRELGAEFLAAGSGNLFDAPSLERSLVEVTDRARHGTIAIGGDVGLVNDSTSFVVVQRGASNPYQSSHPAVAVLEVSELRPTRGKPLELETIVRRVAQLCDQYGARRVRVDNHSLPQMREWAEKTRARVIFEAASESPKDRELRFTRAANLVKAQRLQVPRAYASLIEQLGSLVATPSDRGGYSYSAPRRAGNHCDQAMAALLAIEQVIVPTHAERWAHVAASPNARVEMVKLALGMTGGSYGSIDWQALRNFPRWCRYCHHDQRTSMCSNDCPGRR